ncbi:MAG: hypothetical protein QNJ91_09630 [Gammaproteobacteria bacterium]|nr:hypothetical protein [Gammaproteobacteria bacterium]
MDSTDTRSAEQGSRIDAAAGRLVDSGRLQPGPLAQMARPCNNHAGLPGPRLTRPGGFVGERDLALSLNAAGEWWVTAGFEFTQPSAFDIAGSATPSIIAAAVGRAAAVDMYLAHGAGPGRLPIPSPANLQGLTARTWVEKRGTGDIAFRLDTGSAG